ncbi:CP family cyanate transporter-like MFS transporter [Terracoccus luteus]|uniref:CP family cyanate transporter-like MFS transporter n=1 Tax=Terracoccus luteus TaxID=53356 RepID=A0A495XUI2_9MICO|nr:MFS transporter [Terracoccus luteus]RKT78190.1 CP family cyanate transporter-like MFS transporter [Terracoccus luteus]
MPDATTPRDPRASSTGLASRDTGGASAPSAGLPSFWVLAAVLVAVAANLRVAITSVPPLLDEVSAALGLSHAAAGALTTLPVLSMGVFAPVASRLAHRIGPVAAVLLAAVAVLLGTLSRFGAGNVVLLYVGTFVAGVGIAVGGTLLPRLVKTFFPPERVGLVTGLYMLAMMGGAAVSSAASVPLADALGSWQASLGSWSVLAVVGVAAWAPLTRRLARFAGDGSTTDTVSPEPGRTTSVGVQRNPMPWRHRTAWALALYLAAQSWCFYSSVTWLAPTYVERGWSPTDAGYLGAVFASAQIVSGLLGPVVSDRVRDLRLLLVPFAVIGVVGTVGVWLAPEAAPWVWAAVVGLGQGAAFSLGLVMLVRYAVTPEASGRLTGMAFLISYGLASVGPILMGSVRDVTGSLSHVWAVLTLVGVAQGLVSLRLHPRRDRVA